MSCSWPGQSVHQGVRLPQIAYATEAWLLWAKSDAISRRLAVVPGKSPVGAWDSGIVWRELWLVSHVFAEVARVVSMLWSVSGVFVWAETMFAGTEIKLCGLECVLGQSVYALGHSVYSLGQPV